MSVQATVYVWEHSTRKGSELLLLLAIANIADRRGRAFPGMRRLARDIRMSVRNTQRVLRRIVESGELSVHENRGPNGTHLYQITINETMPLFHPEGGDDKLSPDNLTGDIQGPKGVTSRAQRGDTAMSSEQSLTKNRTGKESAARPDWLPTAWEEFEQHRKEKRATLTPTARTGCIKKLARWRDQGHDVAAILRYSIDNGYTGLFEPKDKPRGKQHELESRNAAVVAAALKEPHGVH